MKKISSFISKNRAFCGVLSIAIALGGCGGGQAGNAGNAPTTQLHALMSTSSAQAPATIRMHYHRAQGDAAQWGVYSWDGPITPSPAWIIGRFLFSGTDSFGGFVDIPVNTAKSAIHFLVTDGNGNKNCGNDQAANFAPDIGSLGQQVWMLESDCTVYASQPPISFGNLNKASAQWLSSTTLAWPGVPTTGSYRLYYAERGGLGSDVAGVTGADASVPLTIAAGLPTPLKDKFPQLAHATALTVSGADAAVLAAHLSAQFAVAQFDSNGALLQVTSLQTAGLLDDLFASAAGATPLGVTFSHRGVPTFRVWAPTAKSVSLDLYADANSARVLQVPMKIDPANGVWSYSAPDGTWSNRFYYTYTVNVLSRWAGNTFVTNTVTDPYSLSLNANSQRSFIANLDSAILKPNGWNDTDIPRLEHATDIALYELHIRDFSASDATVPAAHRGKYLAFADSDSNGMRHLKSLRRAGMTHIHLLPSFDFASVNELGCSTPTIPNAAANAPDQQAAAVAAQDSDCFNWGYDPVHYTAPEGSYSTDANDGAVRIREYRAMVQALHAAGLRVTMDVVYNHTSSAQQNSLSVLDKIVPTYYYRLNADGENSHDSCCADTAAEHAMMAKLMIDSVSTWASQYKVDSFRFDIMGFAPLAVMTQLQKQVNAAAGRDIYLYGEAWNFGSVANDARFVQARQANMFGSGIGSFNDRLRDAVRGGGCCDGGSSLISQQGFINGAYTDPNALSHQTSDDLLRLADLVRVGLSGTLRDYSFVDRTGVPRKNGQIDYFGQGAGFAANPSEIINYVEAHDNQTLFDLNAYKLPVATSIADRVRVQNLGAAITMFSQGIPFFHAGQDMLRSKSMDRDSYNAGDWFNRLDFSYQTNNFGAGLPIAAVNQDNWPLMSPLLGNPLIKPAMSDILASKNYFTELLAMRKDSALFRMRSGQDVIDRLHFLNVGPQQVPGVIVMRLDGQKPRPYAGAKYKNVVVLFNVDKVAKTVTLDELKGHQLRVHPIQRRSVSDKLARTAGYDAADGTFTLPARTTVVFVERGEGRHQGEGEGDDD